jgi:alpha-ketoglutarate-dependent taurine dioxygenase
MPTAALDAVEPRAWTAETVDAPGSWYYPLPASGPSALPAVLQALEAGRGFAILGGPPERRSSAEELRALYWAVGQCLGRPVAQDVRGTLFYDVRDTGQDLAQGARFSVTSYESTFHTDNSFGAEVVDYVGLLCLSTARAGGRSQLVSGYAVHDELRRSAPEVLDVLSRPFHVDRRGGVRPGEPPTVQRPVVAWEGGGLVFRYLRHWIEAGHQKAGAPLTPAQVGALDALDEVLRRPGLRVEFDLRPGEMFFINNRWLLHNRTAFEDHPEPERRRHLVRLWLRTKPA